MTVENKQTNTQEETTASPDAPAADLNISDLMALRSIVEVASQRGAFKAAELETVGKSFNKLNTFLEAVAASKKEE